MAVLGYFPSASVGYVPGCKIQSHLSCDTQVKILSEIRDIFPTGTIAGYDSPTPHLGQIMQSRYKMKCPAGHLETLSLLPDAASYLRSSYHLPGLSGTAAELLNRQLDLMSLIYNDIRVQEKDPALPYRMISNALSEVSSRDDLKLLLANAPAFFADALSLVGKVNDVMKRRVRREEHHLNRTISAKCKSYGFGNSYDKVRQAISSHRQAVENAASSDTLGVGSDGLMEILRLNGCAFTQGELEEICQEEYAKAKESFLDYSQRLFSSPLTNPLMQRSYPYDQESLQDVYEKEISTLFSLLKKNGSIDIEKLPRISVVPIPPEYRSFVHSAVYENLKLMVNGTGLARGFDNPMLDRKLLCSHEIGGHFLQDVLTGNLEPVQLAWMSHPLLEGVAVYMETVLSLEAGYYDEQKHFFHLLRENLRYATAFRQELELHRQGTEDAFREVIGSFISIGMTPVEAAAEANDMLATPGYRMSYLLGKIGVLFNRDYAFSRGMTSRQFHNLLFGNGQIPMDFLSKCIDIYCSLEKFH